MNHHLLRQLTPTGQNQTLKLRIARLWETIIPTTKKFIGLDFIAIDSEVQIFSYFIYLLTTQYDSQIFMLNMIIIIILILRREMLFMNQSKEKMLTSTDHCLKRDLFTKYSDFK